MKTCKHCGGKIKGKICVECLMPKDVPKNECNQDGKHTERGEWND